MLRYAVELINRDSHGWNKGMLENLFFPDEVKAVLLIPISTNQSDAVTWGGNN